ncbi:hypothetical protein ATZ36_06445 [Candidatus Endomicrobiellum trichonymphae]|uniref:Uncharacterized protein n=1 Tax=Endomicrobium trichonymphae TaxID=1408204 RepID=A0A1E5IHR5_ENDTX|nr:hypothetical protein ATZ36_06445 [Candidatus Endomicrobium trichonymphae]
MIGQKKDRWLFLKKAYPFCNEIRNLIRRTVYEIEIKYYFCGTAELMCVLSSTKAESEVNRQSAVH